MASNFEGAFVLTKSHRQESNDFKALLDRLSKGTSTLSDYNVLKKRFSSEVSSDECKSFRDAIRLFTTKDEVLDFNTEVLEKLVDSTTKEPVPIARIPARNNSKVASKATSDTAEGLENVLYIGKGCKVMLKKNLWTKMGLVNGAIGHVVDLLYEENSSYPNAVPDVILCEFPSYKGPKFIKDTCIVPIAAVTNSWDQDKGRGCSRTQFPLQVCYACTVHKSQGLTLNEVSKFCAIIVLFVSECT